MLLNYKLNNNALDIIRVLPFDACRDLEAITLLAIKGCRLYNLIEQIHIV